MKIPPRVLILLATVVTRTLPALAAGTGNSSTEDWLIATYECESGFSLATNSNGKKRCEKTVPAECPTGYTAETDATGIDTCKKTRLAELGRIGDCSFQSTDARKNYTYVAQTGADYCKRSKGSSSLTNRKVSCNRPGGKLNEDQFGKTDGCLIVLDRKDSSCSAGTLVPAGKDQCFITQKPAVGAE